MGGYELTSRRWLIKWLLRLVILVAGIHGCTKCLEKKDPKIVEVCFTPGGNCLHIVEKAILAAEDEIFIQAYVFTSRPIALALIRAHTKGVLIKVLVDRSQLTYKGSQIKRLIKKGIPVWVDEVEGIAHNKVLILDDRYIVTGSYNWTAAAEGRNAENLILIDHKATNDAYRANWEERLQNAREVSLLDCSETQSSKDS